METVFTAPTAPIQKLEIILALFICGNTATGIRPISTSFSDNFLAHSEGISVDISNKDLISEFSIPYKNGFEFR